MTNPDPGFDRDIEVTKKFVRKHRKTIVACTITAILSWKFGRATKSQPLKELYKAAEDIRIAAQMVQENNKFLSEHMDELLNAVTTPAKPDLSDAVAKLIESFAK